MDKFTRDYIRHALWSSHDDDGTPLDDATYGEDLLAPETVAAMVADCADFQTTFADDLAKYQDITGYNGGGDFWLTRNRHGAGFWDRGAEDIGTRLTTAAHSFGSRDLYIGDDGLIYQA